ncbi:hypothetical protein Ddc_18550 [Ditylenchus destructor]|nr:hypothetical protein Ddc_18550 [Ditylenchus destructor]
MSSLVILLATVLVNLDYVLAQPRKLTVHINEIEGNSQVKGKFVLTQPFVHKGTIEIDFPAQGLTVKEAVDVCFLKRNDITYTKPEEKKYGECEKLLYMMQEKPTKKFGHAEFSVSSSVPIDGYAAQIFAPDASKEQNYSLNLYIYHYL